MAWKWNLLQLGTKIRVKGGDDIEGTIIQHFTDEGEIKGYIVKVEKGKYLICALDDEIEVLGM